MFRICLCTDSEVDETWDTLKGGINDVFVNSQYTHVRFEGCDEVMEASAVYGKDGKPLVFIGLDVTEDYKKYSKKLDIELKARCGKVKEAI